MISNESTAEEKSRAEKNEEFRRWMKEAQAWAKEVGYREEDIPEIIKSVRRRKRACAS